MLLRNTLRASSSLLLLSSALSGKPARAFLKVCASVDLKGPATACLLIVCQVRQAGYAPCLLVCTAWLSG